MWLRTVSAFSIAAVLVLGAAGPVLAGGWAVTTLDALPDAGFQAGATYRVGYTIRQHGQHPFAGAKTAITITSMETGERETFVSVPDGPIGHYVAEVRFPSAGAWDWEVSQYPFGPQALGSISVAATGPGTADLTAQASSNLRGTLPEAVGLNPGATGWLVLALPVATVLATGLFALRLVAVVRRRRIGPSL